MKEISIISGQPFKSKVIRYSKSEHDKIVTAHVLLCKVNDHVYLAEDQKSENNNKENDSFAIVLKVNEVYFEVATYNRSMIETYPEIVKNATEMSLNYTSYIESLISEVKDVQLIHIEVYKILGLDVGPLWKAREARKELEETRKSERLHKEEKQRQEAQRQEQERLTQVKQDFINDECIKTDDFLALCKQAGINIHIRTKGTFNKNVTYLKKSGSIQYNTVKRRKPNLAGCVDAIRIYNSFLENDIPDKYTSQTEVK